MLNSVEQEWRTSPIQDWIAGLRVSRRVAVHRTLVANRTNICHSAHGISSHGAGPTVAWQTFEGIGRIAA